MLRLARERRIRIPDDLALAGGDDIELAEFLEVPLTTFRQPAREIGMRGTESLIARLRLGSQALQQLVFKPKLIVRRSSGWKLPSG